MLVYRCFVVQFQRLFCVVILATFLMTMANMEGEESFDASMLGTCEEIVQERICDDELILIKG